MLKHSSHIKRHKIKKRGIMRIFSNRKHKINNRHSYNTKKSKQKGGTDETNFNFGDIYDFMLDI